MAKYLNVYRNGDKTTNSIKAENVSSGQAVN